MEACSCRGVNLGSPLQLGPRLTYSTTSSVSTIPNAGTLRSLYEADGVRAAGGIISGGCQRNRVQASVPTLHKHLEEGKKLQKPMSR